MKLSTDIGKTLGKTFTISFLKLTDAKVSQVVVEAGGKATPASLYRTLEYSIDEARKKIRWVATEKCIRPGSNRQRFYDVRFLNTPDL